MGDTQTSTAELSGRWIQHGIRQKDGKQWTEALEAFDKALTLDTRNPQAWALKARVLDEMNNLPEAIRCYKTALELNPNIASTWNNKGYCFRKQQKYSAALECYREAVRLQPNYAKAWYNMGYVLDKQGNYEAALDAFSRAIELAPDNEKYVASRKAVEATWREFQKVFDNSVSSTSQASLRDTTELSPPQPRAPTAHRPPNKEIPDSLLNPTSNSSSNGHPPSPHMQSDFNPFLDFETSEHIAPATTTASISGPIHQNQGASLSRPHSPHLAPMEPSMPQRDTVGMLHTSHADSMPIAMQHTAAGAALADEGLLDFAYVPASSGNNNTGAMGTGSGSESLMHGHLALQRMTSSASNSSPNLTSSGSLRTSLNHGHHHSHHGHTHGHQQPAHVATQHKESRRTSSERPHNVGLPSHPLPPPHRTPTTSASDETSSSSTGSNPGEITPTFSAHNSPHLHARSMSAASATMRPSAAFTSHSTNGGAQMNAATRSAELNASDASALLNTLKTSLLSQNELSMPTTGALGGVPNGAGMQTTSTLGLGLIAPQKPLTSPDGSDSEYELVPVGLPRAKTYLEAIYTHLQCVKTVKDAEKLEKALEEMLAAVKVKRSFLASQIAASSDTSNQEKCACCWERPPEMVCIPCGHLCICEECKSKLRQKKCPICSQPVKNIYKVFK